MNSRQLARVGLGLIGVWALVDVLNGFMTFAAVVGSGEPPGPVLLYLGVPVALLLGLSYVLVFHNAQLAATIAPDADAASEHGTPDLARILVALLGVMLLVQAIPRTLNAILLFFAAGEFPVAPPLAGPIRNFIGVAVQVAIAIYLIIRPDRLVEFVRRARAERTG